jgi:hypothetical protein
MLCTDLMMAPNIGSTGKSDVNNGPPHGAELGEQNAFRSLPKSTLRVSNLVEKGCLTLRYVVDIARYRSKGGSPGGLSSLLQYQ